MKRSPRQDGLTGRLAALSDPMRLRMCRLLEREELSVGEVARVIQSPQSSTSRHLKVLLDAGLLVRRGDGTAVMYRLPPDALADDARGLWTAVSRQLEHNGHNTHDDRRLRAVLAERRTDTASFFGRVGGEWDRVRAELFGGAFAAHAIPALLPGDWVVADLGCGTGAQAEMLAPFIKRIICVDQSGAMLEAARSRLHGRRNVKFVQSVVERTPLQNRSVDAAMCILVLHHLDDPALALHEMARIVRVGGVAMVVEMVEHDRAEYRQTMGHVHLGFSGKQMRALFTKARFEPPRIRPLPTDASAQGPGLFVASARLKHSGAKVASPWKRKRRK